MHKNSIVVGLTVIFSLLIAYHVAILLGASDNLYAWGSNTKENENIILLELFAIGVTLFSQVVVLLKRYRAKKLWIELSLWAITALYFVSTLANLFADNWYERVLGSGTAGVVVFLLLKLRKI